MTDMTDKTQTSSSKTTLSPATARERVAASLAARHGRERRFRNYGRFAIALAITFLLILFGSIFTKGIPGFFQHYVTFDVVLDAEELDPYGDASAQSLCDGNARGVIRDGLFDRRAGVADIHTPQPAHGVDHPVAGMVRDHRSFGLRNDARRGLLHRAGVAHGVPHMAGVVLLKKVGIFH